MVQDVIQTLSHLTKWILTSATATRSNHIFNIGVDRISVYWTYRISGFGPAQIHQDFIKKNASDIRNPDTPVPV